MEKPSTAREVRADPFPDPALPVVDFTGPALVLFWPGREREDLRLPFRLILSPDSLGPGGDEGFWEDQAVRFNSFQGYIDLLWWDPLALLELWRIYLRQVRRELIGALGNQRNLYLLVPTHWEPGVSLALRAAMDQVSGLRTDLVLTSSACHLFSALGAGWGRGLEQGEETECRLDVNGPGPESQYHLFGLRREGERLRAWFAGYGREEADGQAEPELAWPTPAARGYLAMLGYLADPEQPRVDLDMPLELGLYGRDGGFTPLPETTPGSRGWTAWQVEHEPGSRPGVSLAARPSGFRDGVFPLGRLSLQDGKGPLRLALKWLHGCAFQARVEWAQGGEAVEDEFHLPRLCR